MRINVLFCILACFLTGCSTLKEKNKGKTVDELHSSATALMKENEHADAAQVFKEISTLYPYAHKAYNSQIMAAYCYFLAENYDDANNELEVFLRYHATHELVPYAMYLRAMCSYMRVCAVGRDSKNAIDAKQMFLTLTNKFRTSIYHADCLKKIELLNDIIAAHEMSVGRHYEVQNNALSAIGRYNKVISMFPDSEHAAEAYYRIIKCCKFYNLDLEMQKALAALQSKFPQSKWLKKAKNALSIKK